MNTIIRTTKLRVLVIALICSSGLQAQSASEHVSIENYYRVKWGYADEFIELWKTNHYPLLKKALEKGDIILIKADKPALHSGEDTRWDFKVVITFKDIKTAFDPDLTTPYKKTLYLDSAGLAKAEQHRFSLLLAHWDILVQSVKL